MRVGEPTPTIRGHLLILIINNNIVTLPERLIALCRSPAFTYKGNRTLAGLRGGSAVGSRLPRGPLRPDKNLCVSTLLPSFPRLLVPRSVSSPTLSGGQLRGWWWWCTARAGRPRTAGVWGPRASRHASRSVASPPALVCRRSVPV